MFSERENQILKIIGKKKHTLHSIALELFKSGEQPLDPEIAVGNTVRRIIKKCIHHKLNWTLEKKKVGKHLLIWRKQ